MKQILVTGDREWQDMTTIQDALEAIYVVGDTVIHGACRGADMLAQKVCEEQGWQYMAIPAGWDKHGPAAGPIRNRKMLAMLDPRTAIVLAFHADLSKSKGTRDMVEIASEKGMEVWLYTGKERTQLSPRHPQLFDKPDAGAL